MDTRKRSNSLIKSNMTPLEVSRSGLVEKKFSGFASHYLTLCSALGLYSTPKKPLVGEGRKSVHAFPLGKKELQAIQTHSNQFTLRTHSK